MCHADTHTWSMDPGLTFQGLTREILRDGERDEKKERRKEDRRNRERRDQERCWCVLCGGGSKNTYSEALR